MEQKIPSRKPARMFLQNEQQRQVAFQAAEQAKAKTAPIRFRFIARSEDSDPAPPMARMLRGGGGRGGSTRLKLFLSLLWLARSRENPVFGYRAQSLAALLGLPKPDTAGARRIHEALRWLEEESFVALDRRPGDATRVHLLDDAGTGARYRPPGPLAKPAKGRSLKEREQHYFARLDSKFWTEGWVAQLSGPAVAMYLAALHEERGRTGETIWISPRIGRERYDLSDETRNKGLRELVDYQLLELERRPVPQTSFDERYRARNAYRISPDGFTRSPTDPVLLDAWIGWERDEP